mmetsp:Transcript_496/g.1503  ORF Transcript_496/g.1503 Transcript_496/m.1503 type:complete len:370 (+) Transcript_496:47-1156(+)
MLEFQSAVTLHSLDRAVEEHLFFPFWPLLLYISIRRECNHPQNYFLSAYIAKPTHGQLSTISVLCFAILVSRVCLLVPVPAVSWLLWRRGPHHLPCRRTLVPCLHLRQRLLSWWSSSCGGRHGHTRGGRHGQLILSRRRGRGEAEVEVGQVVLHGTFKTERLRRLLSSGHLFRWSRRRHRMGNGGSGYSDRLRCSRGRRSGHISGRHRRWGGELGGRRGCNGGRERLRGVLVQLRWRASHLGRRVGKGEGIVLCRRHNRRSILRRSRSMVICLGMCSWRRSRHREVKWIHCLDLGRLLRLRGDIVRLHFCDSNLEDVRQVEEALPPNVQIVLPPILGGLELGAHISCVGNESQCYTTRNYPAVSELGFV